MGKKKRNNNNIGKKKTNPNDSVLNKGNKNTSKISIDQLIDKLDGFSNEIKKYQTNNFEKFKDVMKEFRNFLNESTSAASKYAPVFNYFILNDNNYPKYKKAFTNAENFYERIIELDENEKIVSSQEKVITLDNLGDFLSDEFNKLFLQDVNIEIEKLKEHITYDNFVMVGCGSLPITLLAFCNQYKNGKFVGIDHSSEAIKKAIEIKNKLNISNLNFDIIDGENYDYKNADTVFVANTVVHKIDILKQIAMSAKGGTRIIIRIPSYTGHLLSEDVTYINIPRITLLKEFPADEKTDDELYKLLLLEIR